MLHVSELSTDVGDCPRTRKVRTVVARASVAPLRQLTGILRLNAPSGCHGRACVGNRDLCFPANQICNKRIVTRSLVTTSEAITPSHLPGSVRNCFVSTNSVHRSLLFSIRGLHSKHSFSTHHIGIARTRNSVLATVTDFRRRSRRNVRFTSPVPRGVPSSSDLADTGRLVRPCTRRSPFTGCCTRGSPFSVHRIAHAVVLNTSGGDTDRSSNGRVI